MSLFGTRKSRSARAAQLKASTSQWTRFNEAISDRTVVLRLFIGFLAVIGLTVVTQGWTSSFRYRLDDHTETGITARRGFRRINRLATDRARSDREALAPLVFRRDSELIASLPARLNTHLGDVAQADDVTKVPDETRKAFGMTTPGSSAGEFSTLKGEISLGGDSVGNRISEIVADFEQFIAPLYELGVVDPDELTRQEITDVYSEGLKNDATIRIIEAGSEPVTATVADILLDEQVKDTGQLGKAWNSYPQLASMRTQLEVWLKSKVPFTLSYENALTVAGRREARNSVSEKYELYSKGTVLVPPGEYIDRDALDLMEDEYASIDSQVGWNQRILRLVTVFMMFTVMAVLFGVYLVRNEPGIIKSVQSLSVFLVGSVVTVGLSRMLSFDPWRAEIIPLLATVMVFAIAYNQVLAMVTAFALSLIIALSDGSDIGQFVILMSVTTTAIIPLSRVPTRSTIIKVGFLTALVCFFVSWGIGLIESQVPMDTFTDGVLLMRSLKTSAWCLLASYFVAGSLPFVESTFGVVTDISLLEMSDISHPLLQELVRRAPGTYNHSISVATIAETAADAIGANGLLVRVGAYFHDIGKMLKPEYFIENKSHNSESRHENLAPAMSTLIIIGHVKDGVDLAQQHKLPQRLIDFIEQHHGTTLVEYFFREATRQADEDHKTDAEESSFRYPGPKPQSSEAGVMMLADAVESASRTLSEPTPKRIETLVHELTMKRLLDGQFDECSLKLSEIRTIEESLIKSLIGIYHGRIKYPEQQTA
jgi:putative nucleotidyltransferase with HDIG domain